MMDVANAQHLAQSHYENFPVVPFFLPKAWKKATALIYAFARTADDIADEGDIENAVRLNQLNAMAAELSNPQSDFFETLLHTVDQHQLPLAAFYDLLKAFKQDVVQKQYPDETALLDYCQHSAAPVGRLMLALSRHHNEQLHAFSDAICNGLQLINFLQDLKSDIQTRHRFYIPQTDMVQHQVTMAMLRNEAQSADIQSLIEQQWQRAFKLIDFGRPLLSELNGRFYLMIALTVLGADQMLIKLKGRPSIYERPTLKRSDWVRLTMKLLMSKERYLWKRY